MFLLLFVRASIRGTDGRLKAGTSVLAVVNTDAYAYKVGDRVSGVRRAGIKTVRWLFGTAAILPKESGIWLIVPGELFPTRPEWRKLTGKSDAHRVVGAKSLEDDVPNWGG
jgi:hypothetical protein